MPTPLACRFPVLVGFVVAFTIPLGAQFAEMVQPRRLPPFPYGQRQIVPVDLDGDGDVDLIAIAAVGADGVILLRNDGLGAFTDVTPANVAGGETPGAATAGDLDGDGDIDLVLTRYAAASVFLNDGQGRYTEAGGPTYSYSGSTFATVRLADVDRDGDLDIVDRDFGSTPHEVRLWRNDGRARFTRDTASLPPAGARGFLALFDVENDGDIDVVVHDGTRFTMWVNDGAGRFTDLPARIVGPAAGPMVAGDVDGDGDLDLVTATGANGMRVLVNDGAGFFTSKTGHIPAAVAGVPALGDVDADGDLDLVATGYLSAPGQLFLCHNDGRGSFTDVTATHVTPRGVGAAPHVAFADFDGDRDADLAVPGTPSRFFAGSPAGRLAADDPPEIGGAVGALGDVDGDGDADMVVGTILTPICLGAENWLARNDGLGRFTAEPLASPSEHTTRVRLVDLDGDGDLDLLEANSPVYCHSFYLGGYEYAYFNDGRGAFAMVGLFGPQNTTADIVAADIDGDGDQDVLAANAPGLDNGQNRLYVNLGGTRGFNDETARLPPDTDATRLILPGDVDGDGDVDLVCVNMGQDRLFLNDGRGSFTDATAGRLPIEAFDAAAGLLHDLDQDGDLDLLLAGRWLYLNDGTGVFTDASGARLPPLPGTGESLGLLDADGDGDPDVVVGTRAGNRLLLNAAGSFSIAPPDRFPVDRGSVGLLTGDLDADGDDDVLFAPGSYPYTRVYANLARQVYAPRLLQAGRPCTLQLFARAGFASAPQKVIPVVGFDRLAAQPIRVPDWGSFRLSLDPLVVLPALLVPFPAGMIAVDLLVPRELDDVRLFVQTLVLHAPSPAEWRFSNALYLQR